MFAFRHTHLANQTNVENKTSMPENNELNFILFYELLDHDKFFFTLIEFGLKLKKFK